MRLTTVAAVLTLVACGANETPAISAASVENGRLLLRQYGCGACHSIPGVVGASGNVGPPLEKIARRVYLAGMLPNTPQNMIDWIRAPHAFDPQTAMPDLKVSQPHAADMAAYFYTLR